MTPPTMMLRFAVGDYVALSIHRAEDAFLLNVSCEQLFRVIIVRHILDAVLVIHCRFTVDASGE